MPFLCITKCSPSIRKGSPASLSGGFSDIFDNKSKDMQLKIAIELLINNYNFKQRMCLNSLNNSFFNYNLIYILIIL